MQNCDDMDTIELEAAFERRGIVGSKRCKDPGKRRLCISYLKMMTTRRTTSRVGAEAGCGAGWREAARGLLNESDAYVVTARVLGSWTSDGCK